MVTFHVIPLFLVIASEAWNLKVCACAMILDSSLRSATFRMTECQHYLVKLLDASGWIELLDAVDYGGPQRSFCGPVSRRVWRGWRSLPSAEGVLIGSGPARIGAGEGLRA